MLYIDFETRSRTDIDYGAWKYSLCPSTDILCFAWAIDDGPVQLWKPGMDFPQWATDEEYFSTHCKVVEAHNASFEQAIWKNVCIPRYGWIYVPPIKWLDSMAQCAAAAIPLSLQNACIAINTDKKKDQEGKLVMQQLSKPRKPTASNKKEWHEYEDYPEKFETLYSYCIDDVEAERSLSKSLPSLIKRERWVWVLDQIINQRGVKVDIPLVKKALKLIEQHKKNGLRRMAELTNGEVTTTQQVAKLREWLASRDVDLPDLQKATIENVLAEGGLPEDALEILKIRQSLSKSSTSKLDKMLGCADQDGLIRYTLLYHGASTGRWAGRLIQVQNFPKGAPHIKNVDEAIADLASMSLDQLTEKYGDVMDLISTCLRGMIISSPGHDLISADLNAIEARIVMWLAEQEDAILAYLNNEDNYVKMAAYLNDKPEADVTKAERQLGKQVILGCFAEDTLVLTDSGWKAISDVSVVDRLWDGVQWVHHKGVIFQGWKTTIPNMGVRATPEHKVLSGGQWVEWQTLLTNPSLAQLALSTGNLPSLGGTEGLINWGEVWDTIHGSGVLADTKGLLTEDTLLLGIQRGATPVPKERAGELPLKNIGSTTTYALTSNTVRGCLTGYPLASRDVVTPKIPTFITTAAEELKLHRNGLKTEETFSSTYARLTVGTTQFLSLIASTLIKDTKQVIYDLFRDPKTCAIEELYRVYKNASKSLSQKTPVYDLWDVGPNNRFTILTSQGPLIVHNCGFSMGAEKFLATCIGYGMDVSPELASKAVKAYREKYSKVPTMWKNYENAAIDAVITCEPQYANKVTWEYNKKRDVLYCILPSGRSLSYVSPRIEQRDMTFFDRKTNKMKTVKKPSLTYLTVSSVGNQWVRNHTYGGHLTENIAQAIARDCLVEGLFRLEKKKYLTIMTVHDEVVAQVPEGYGSVEELESLLSISPDWAPDLPIKAEGWRAKRYRK